jgi:hypothetical protein
MLVVRHFTSSSREIVRIPGTLKSKKPTGHSFLAGGFQNLELVYLLATQPPRARRHAHTTAAATTDAAATLRERLFARQHKQKATPYPRHWQ